VPASDTRAPEHNLFGIIKLMDNLISIITPTYNRGYIIRNPIDSILKQTYLSWELLIVDDGSTDNTEKIVGSYKDKRIKYIKQKKKDQAAARNKGLKMAQGKWITYLDSDNEFLPNYLGVMIKTFKKHKRILYILPKANRTLELFAGKKLIKIIDDSVDFPSSLTIKDIFLRKLHFDLNGFIHSVKIRDEGIRFDESISVMEDWEFIMQIGEKHPENFLYLPVILYNYHQRYGGDGIVSNTSYKQWADIFEHIYQKHKNDKLMVGQSWYPDRVNKWNKIEKNFKKGLIPPPHLFRFQK